MRRKVSVRIVIAVALGMLGSVVVCGGGDCGVAVAVGDGEYKWIPRCCYGDVCGADAGWTLRERNAQVGKLVVGMTYEELSAGCGGPG